MRWKYLRSGRSQLFYLSIRRAKKKKILPTTYEILSNILLSRLTPYADFKKAYDSFKREVLYNIFIEFGIPMKLVRLIKMLD